MKKIIVAALAALAGLLGLSNARGAENPYYDPEYDSEIGVVYASVYDPDAPDEVTLTFEGVTPQP